MKAHFNYLKDALNLVNKAKSDKIQFHFRETGICDISAIDSQGFSLMTACIPYESDEKPDIALWFATPTGIKWTDGSADLDGDHLTVGSTVHLLASADGRTDMDYIRRKLHTKEVQSVWVNSKRLRTALEGFGTNDVMLSIGGEYEPVRIEYDNDFGKETAYVMPVKH